MSIFGGVVTFIVVWWIVLFMVLPFGIKSQIESEFKKDSEGNFENIEAVMRKLEEFTEMYNDPKIADMIYYDEEDSKFKWKV